MVAVNCYIDNPRILAFMYCNGNISTEKILLERERERIMFKFFGDFLPSDHMLMKLLVT